MLQFINKIKSDPFIPEIIRREIVEHLESRAKAINEIHIKNFSFYLEELYFGKLDKYEIATSPVQDLNGLKYCKILKNSFGNNLERDSEAIAYNSTLLHNLINLDLYEKGFGISQVEKDVHHLRLLIQEYFESFNPLK